MLVPSSRLVLIVLAIAFVFGVLSMCGLLEHVSTGFQQFFQQGVK